MGTAPARLDYIISLRNNVVKASFDQTIFSAPNPCLSAAISMELQFKCVLNLNSTPLDCDRDVAIPVIHGALQHAKIMQTILAQRATGTAEDNERREGYLNSDDGMKHYHAAGLLQQVCVNIAIAFIAVLLMQLPPDPGHSAITAGGVRVARH